MMSVIKYIHPGGKETTIEVKNGLSVMHGAVTNMVEGILAECGGALTCATCHCYIDPSWIQIVGVATGKEKHKLNLVDQPKANSRLSCQITVQDELDGLIVHFPESQVRAKN